MKRNRIVLLALFFLIKLSVSFAQVDTSFWFACPWVTPDHTFRQDYKMHIATFNNPVTTIRVRQPGAIAPNRYDTTLFLPPNSNYDFSFWRDKLASTTNRGFDSLEVQPANTVLPYGLYISSDANITIVYDVITSPPTFYNPETFSMKGQNGLGLEFICPFQTKWHNQVLGDLGGTQPGVNQPKQQINIVASQPNTLVWITPKTGVVGHAANVTYSVMLPIPGSAYTVENLNSLTDIPGNNLSGSIVVADKPIAVTVADDSVDGLTGCYDLMGDQIVPVDIVDVDYILNKGYMNAAEPDGAFIVGTQNFTQLTINDGATTIVMINKGDTYHYHTTQPLTYVHATFPVYVLQATGVGNGCELGEALLPPINCAGSNLVAFSRNTPQNFFLNILCKSGSQSTFTLSNSTATITIPITAANFTFAPGTTTLNPPGGYYGAQLNLNSTVTLPVGSYTIGNNTDVFALGVLDGGPGTGGLFHYMSSFLRKTFVSIPPPSSVCASPGAQVPLTGTVSGGAITGIWSTNGSGTFGAYTSTVNTISTVYTMSNSDTLLTSLVFSLTSTGNCTPKTGTISVPIVQRPKIIITSATPTVICKNNVTPISLTGTFAYALGAGWSGGTGFFPLGPNISYTPTATDLSAGALTLTLSSINNSICPVTSRTVGINFVNPPTIFGIDDNVCPNTQTVILNASVTGSTVAPLWTTTNGTGLFLPSNQTLTPTYQLSSSDYSLTAIIFTVTLPPTGPCSSVSDVVQLTMRPAPKAIAPADFTVCANAGLINLNGNIAGSATSGSWATLNGTGAFIPPSAPPVSNYTMSFNDMSIGTLTYVLTGGPSIYPNCPDDHDTLKVAVLDAPIVTVNTNTSVCENAPVALTGTVTGYTNTGIWSSTGTGAFTPTNTALGGQYFPSAGDVAIGTVTLTLLSSNNQGCPAQSNSFVATFIDAPKALFTPSSIRCKDSSITFFNGSQPNGTSGLSYNWNFGTAPTNSTQSQTTGNAIYTYTNSGSYIITLTVTGISTTGTGTATCTDTISKRITVNPLPIPNFNYMNACQGLPVLFKDSSIVIPGNVVGFVWYFGDGSVNSYTRNTVHTYTTAGTYNVNLTAISNNSCAATITKPVNINFQPNAEFGMTNDPTVALEPVYFSDFSAPTGSIVSWLWSFGDEGSGSGNSPTHVYQNSGMYVITLTVFDNNGCTDTVSKTIDVQVLPQVPTAFTPNKDNNNDLLFVKGGPFEKMTFKVYDNWGQLLFETTDQTKGWDGTFGGKDQPVGVYVWTLVVDMYNNRQVKKNGDVTIIR